MEIKTNKPIKLKYLLKLFGEIIYELGKYYLNIYPNNVNTKTRGI